MFANMRLNFHGDTMPLLATMLPPTQPAIAGESLGEAELTIPHTVPETLAEPAHSHDQASSPPRPTTILASAQENEQDDVFGGSFDISPPRSTEAPPVGTTLGGAEDPDKLTALCSLVNSLVQKIDSQASDLKAHKLVFKEVVGKLVKKVKELEDKLKERKRKFVMTESNIEEEEEQDVDPFIKLAKAAATAADDSAIPTGGSNKDEIPPSSSIPSDAFAGGSAIPSDVTTGLTDAPSDKGKSPMLEEEPPVRERSFRQREEDRLGAEAVERLNEEEQAEQAREREEQKQKRQKDVLESAKYYTYTDWKCDNESWFCITKNFSADLLGPDVNEDNFAARMVALIAERRRKFAAQRKSGPRTRNQSLLAVIQSTSIIEGDSSLLDRQDLYQLYGWFVKLYEQIPIAWCWNDAMGRLSLFCLSLVKDGSSVVITLSSFSFNLEEMLRTTGKLKLRIVALQAMAMWLKAYKLRYGRFVELCFTMLDFLVADSTYLKIGFGDGCQDVVVQSSGAFNARSI
ncbi:hypothetical protein Tco_0872426 [Tanacetum coccineum]